MSEPGLTMQAMIEDLARTAPSPEAAEHLAGIAAFMGGPSQGPWVQFGASQYAIEWSDARTNAGGVAIRHFEVMRRDRPGRLEALRPSIAATVGRHDDQSSPDTVHVGESQLSLDDARALRTALGLAIDYVEQQLTRDRDAPGPQQNGIHSDPGTDRSK